MGCDTQVIHVFDEGTVRPNEPITLYKGQGHRILWVSESRSDWHICFANQRSPFRKGHTFELGAGKWVESEGIHPDAEVGEVKKYTYEVKAAAKAGTKEVAADPVVIIQP